MPRRAASKAGRNEARKLLGTTLNNLGVAAVLAGFLQPTMTLLRSGRVFGRGDLITALVLGLLGVILHSLARRVVSRLED